MMLTEYILKIVSKLSLFKRNIFLLVDNTFNNNAELVDNFALFEYMQQHTEYKKISYYIINKDNVMFEQIAKKYPKNIIPVKHGQFSWFLLYKLMFAKYWIDSFQVISSFDPKAFLCSGKVTTIYAQHGINFLKTGYIGDKAISPKYFNKIIFSNNSEKLLYDKYYGYNDKNVIMAGLSRWDLIQNRSQEKSIFIYFTSREYLLLINENEITDTKYCKNMKILLNSVQLNKLLNEYNIKIYVALHHQLTHNNILKDKLPNITFVEDKDIGAIKQKASMLITDFSSMCFDFMIKDKPVMFFRVDKGDELLKLSTDNYENDLNVESKNDDLYNIYYDVDSVLNKLKYYIENDFLLEDEYKIKNEKFFTYRSNIRQHLIENILSSPKNIENKKIPNDLSFIKPIKMNNLYNFSSEMPFLLNGFSSKENWGRWTDDKDCLIMFKLSKRQDIEICLDCCAFVGRNHKKLYVSVLINDDVWDYWTFDYKRKENNKKIQINSNDLDNNNVCLIRFKIHNPKSPKELGLSDDTRKLGLGFKSMIIREINNKI